MSDAGNEEWGKQEWVLFGCSLSSRSRQVMVFVSGHFVTTVGLSIAVQVPGLSLRMDSRSWPAPYLSDLG